MWGDFMREIFNILEGLRAKRAVQEYFKYRKNIRTTKDADENLLKTIRVICRDI